MLRRDAISKFLSSQPYDLAQLYTPEMEVQVNVARDGGEPIQGNYAGHRWRGFTDGLTVWKDFRIPWNAATKPEYKDKKIGFNISSHTEAIGMTGWNWERGVSKWVAYDFDAILGHSTGLTDASLQEVRHTLELLSFTNIYSSTSSKGLHLYIFISDIPTANHTEHAALAKAILAQISSLTGLDFSTRVDVMGSNMWVWHRKAIPGQSYQLLKKGNILEDIPKNWKIYLSSSKTKRSLPSSKNLVIAAQHQESLEPEHIKLIEWFKNRTCLAWWDADKHLFVCHTSDLKNAHKQLKLRGLFETISTGKDNLDQNCFMFPLKNGAWIVRRHTRGTIESPLWYTDLSGWTTCYFNRAPPLKTAAILHGGIEDKDSWVFRTLEEAVKTLKILGISCEIPIHCGKRPSSLTIENEYIIISFERHENDDSIEYWIKKKKFWQRQFFRSQSYDDVELPDDLIRKLHPIGWFIKTSKGWQEEKRQEAISVLLSKGYKRKDIEPLLGRCVLGNWQLVNKPFESEYPGNRSWNYRAPKFLIDPCKGEHKFWDSILLHCGASLTEPILQNEWCLDHGILNGLLYLQCWLACVFQEPEEPLPYLFFSGDQNTGKSIFHEVLSLLTNKGIIRADHALTNSSGFNGELLGAVVCVVEETDLSRRGYASDRIKDWVTGKTLSIRRLYREPFDVVNTTHWIQCANSLDYCPIFPGDTRIVSVIVKELKKEIPKPILIEECKKEAPAFLNTILNWELPPSIGRLRIPIIETEIKRQQQSLNKSLLEDFINERTYVVSGEMISLREMLSEFNDWTQENWSARQLGKGLAKLGFTRGKKSGEIYIGNLSFEPREEKENKKCINVDGKLVIIPMEE